MSEQDEPAFPVVENSPTMGTRVSFGISVRDYFAAKAMNSLLRHREAIDMLNGSPEFTWQENCAVASYKVADAMLIARDVRAK